MKIDYKSQILDVLSDYVSGLTIRDISTKIKVHRNTVSKYLNIMEVEGSVKKKKVEASTTDGAGTVRAPTTFSSYGVG